MSFLKSLMSLFGGGAADPNACAGVDDPRYVADHRIPLRAWAHGVLSIYVGRCADPGLHGTEYSQGVLQNGWSLKGPDDLRRLIGNYERGEIGLAFDKARIVRLARHGWGAGWLSEDECWQRIAAAQEAIRQRYGDWESFITDFRQERQRWWTDVAGNAMPDGDRQAMERCFEEARTQVLYTTPMR
jgi:hypothetical protein